MRGRGRPDRDRAAGANLNDFKLLRATLESIPIERPEPTAELAAGPLPRQRLRLQRGLRARATSSGSPPTSAAAREEAQAIKHEAGFRARRWVVERTHSWLNRFRRILIRWEKRADTYLAMLHLACGLITWRAANWERLPQ